MTETSTQHSDFRSWVRHQPGCLKSMLHSVMFWFFVSLFAYCVAAWYTLISPTDVPGDNLPFLTEARSLLTNILASFLLFYLVSYLPDRRRRKSLRVACRKMYRSTKEQILWDILDGSRKGGRTDFELHYGLVEQLMSPDEFRKFFADGKESDEGIYAFRNHIQGDEDDFRSIIFKFKLMARQLEFLLNNVAVENQENLESLKRLEQWLLSLDELHAGYDEEKVLDGAIWAIFAGWSMADGYRGYDPIEKAIEQI
jgi:hypothetical protein